MFHLYEGPWTMTLIPRSFCFGALGTISSTLYPMLLQVRIQKVQNESQFINVFMRFWDQRTLKLCIEHWWNWHLGSISSTFYVMLLHVQIPKAQKWQSTHQFLFALLVSAHVKASSGTLMTLTPRQLGITTFEAAKPSPGSLRTAKEIKGLVNAVASTAVRGKLKILVIDSDL